MIKIYGLVDQNDRGVEEFGMDDVGIFWENKSKRVFEGYVKILREKNRTGCICEKGNKDYNPALRSMLKLLLNSLSGKVGQREFDTDTSFCTDFYQQQKFFKEHTDVQVTPISNLASLILKGEKILNIMSKPQNLGNYLFLYMHTPVHICIEVFYQKLIQNTQQIQTPATHTNLILVN